MSGNVDMARVAVRLQRRQKYALGPALHALRALVGAVEREHPEAGPVFQEHNGRREFRRLLVGRHLLFYTMRGSRILLVRFWDTRRSPNDLVLE